MLVLFSGLLGLNDRPEKIPIKKFMFEKITLFYEQNYWSNNFLIYTG